MFQANDKFWKVKYDHEAGKKARKAKKAARRAAPRKKGSRPSASELLPLDDRSESEVALDSLGSFFNHLIDMDYQQEDTGVSHEPAEEVTIISSDSDPLPRQKV